MPGTQLSTPVQPIELSHEGLAELIEELSSLKDVKLPAVIDRVALGTKKVGIGSVVTVKPKGGKTTKLTIVGEFQGNPKEGKISSVSPLGKALVGKKKDDKVTVTAPAGEVEYTIENIA